MKFDSTILSEMAYSLHLNHQMIYYDENDIGCDENSITDKMKELLKEDSKSLSKSPKDMLKEAECFNPEDKRFIYATIQKIFDKPEEAAALIKMFVDASRRSENEPIIKIIRSPSQVAHGNLQSLPLSASDYISKRSLNRNNTEATQRLSTEQEEKVDDQGLTVITVRSTGYHSPPSSPSPRMKNMLQAVHPRNLLSIARLSSPTPQKERTNNRQIS